MLTKEPLAEIIERARTGSLDAFDDLILHFEGKVLKTALFLTRNLDDARDVAQEVYVKIFRYLHSCEDPGRLDHWVYRITVNAARDFQRRKRLFFPLAKIVAIAKPRDSIFRQEVRSRLTEALALLSFKEKAAFVFKELE